MKAFPLPSSWIAAQKPMQDNIPEVMCGVRCRVRFCWSWLHIEEPECTYESLVSALKSSKEGYPKKNTFGKNNN